MLKNSLYLLLPTVMIGCGNSGEARYFAEQIQSSSEEPRVFQKPQETSSEIPPSRTETPLEAPPTPSATPTTNAKKTPAPNPQKQRTVVIKTNPSGNQIESSPISIHPTPAPRTTTQQRTPTPSTPATSSEPSTQERTPSSTCPQRLNGTWEFGRAPYGCQISTSISSPLEQQYRDFIYDDKKNRREESDRFVNGMHDFLVDVSTSYLQRRSPESTEQDVGLWIHLVLSTAHQESFWTHYRRGEDGMFRFFKGDSDHGYGLMQVDDRWHMDFINSNKVYDLTDHFVYALDALYEIRKKVQRTPCSNGRDNKSINRSIYSYYNGGANAKCRWQNPQHRWARNDKNFLEKYDNKTWESYVR